MSKSNEIQYNDCRTWQTIFMGSGNLVATAFLLLMNFVSYLAVGNYGLLVGVASVIITGSRIFDGVTDPIVAYIIDRTDGKFGRFRPMMVLGFVILAVSVLLMYFLCIGGGTAMFIALYALYVIGYTFWGTAYGGALACMTNNPKQRQSMGRWSGILTQILGVAFSFYMSNYLVRKHVGINIGAMQELAITAILLSAVCAVLSIVALWTKDKPENYKNTTEEPTKVSDMWNLIKGSRNFRMMIVAIVSDRLAQQTAGNSTISVLVWGIVVGNYAFSGQLNLYTLVPMILIILFGSQVAMKNGGRFVTIRFSLFNIVMAALVSCFFIFGDPTKISSNMGYTVVFIIVYCLYVGGRAVTNTVTGPMLSDIADEELYKTGKFIPSMVYAIYSFADKLVSSLSATIVGFAIYLVGYVDVMPQADDPYKPSILYIGLFLWLGMPAIGWLCSVIAMKWYDLTYDRMQEIQSANAEKKASLRTK